MSGYQPLQGLDEEEVRSTLDVLARDGAQRMLVSALEQEVEEFLGRARFAHGAGRHRGYGNGAGTTARLQWPAERSRFARRERAILRNPFGHICCRAISGRATLCRRCCPSSTAKA
jgi:hypothetical protein